MTINKPDDHKETAKTPDVQGAFITAMTREEASALYEAASRDDDHVDSIRNRGATVTYFGGYAPLRV